MDSFSDKNKVMLTCSLSKNDNNTNVMHSTNNLKADVHHGRKTFVFWTLICLLLFLALGNLILTLTILGVLRLGYGMNSLELVPEASTIKFYGDADLGHVYKVDGKINGFSDSALEITGEENGSLLFNLVGRNNRPVNKIIIDANKTLIQNIENFVVKDVNDNHYIFSSNNPHFNLEQPAHKLAINMAHTNRISSINRRNLEIKSDKITYLKGVEGTVIDSKEIIWSADQDIRMSSVNGSIVFTGKEGVSVDFKDLPVAGIPKSDYVRKQYKLCVCIPHGKIFRLPVADGHLSKVNCNHVKMTPSYNPCI